jgi:hypothetical protein
MYFTEIKGRKHAEEPHNLNIVKKSRRYFRKSFLFLEKDPHLEEYVNNTKKIKLIFCLKLLLEKKESAEV